MKSRAALLDELIGVLEEILKEAKAKNEPCKPVLVDARAGLWPLNYTFLKL